MGKSDLSAEHQGGSCRPENAALVHSLNQEGNELGFLHLAGGDEGQPAHHDLPILDERLQNRDGRAGSRNSKQSGGRRAMSHVR